MPFLAGSLAIEDPGKIVPEAYTNTSLTAFRRGKHSAWMASKFVFAAASQTFACSQNLILQRQLELESESEKLLRSAPSNAALVKNAEKNVEAWWALSDAILLQGGGCDYGFEWIKSTGRCT